MTDTHNCSRCGTPIAPGAHYCPSCGLDISGSQGGVATVNVTSPLALKPDALLEALRQAALGEYEVLAELGRGGMATVYLAHDIALDRKIAIKVMSPLLLSGEGMAERFKREARTAGQLSHPHIIPIYAVRESGGLLYFVMKFVEGRPLDSIIREVGPLPIAMVQTILQQVGSALGYAHRRGVIHRDIKPANIMIDSDGWAVVTDFGIAKVSQTPGLTVTGATVGTPSYMSPEQCAAKELDGASDQYSLGVVAYEMLSGKLPFAADSVMAVMYAHFNDPPPPIQMARADCPPKIASAVMRMLEKEPDRRFPTSDAAVAAIGGPPLAPDDPIRTKMMTLAAKSDSLKVLARFTTPVSQPSAVLGTSGARPSIATLLISPERATVSAGSEVQLLVSAKSRDGQTLVSRPMSWASTNTRIARVAPNGLVTAVGPGTVMITASSDNTSATATITVTAVRSRTRVFALVAGGVVLAGIAAILWLVNPFGRGGSNGAPPTDSVTGAASVALDSPTGPTLGVSLPAAETTVAPAPAPPQRVPSRETTPRARDSSESTVATALASARAARAQAVDAGAGETDLSRGDEAVRLAQQLRQSGRRAAAFAQLQRATGLFAEAENTATAARIAAARRLPAPDTASSPPAPPPPVTSAPEPAVDPVPAIRSTIDAYARALERQDINAVLRVFPDIPQSQADSWRQFFTGAEDIRASWQAMRITPTGNQADARVAMTLTFKRADNHAPDRARYEVTIQLARRSSEWVITAVR
ncbi:MAG TPA: protein kinase [Gemmatimonadales bacterium]